VEHRRVGVARTEPGAQASGLVYVEEAAEAGASGVFGVVLGIGDEAGGAADGRPTAGGVDVLEVASSGVEEAGEGERFGRFGSDVFGFFDEALAAGQVGSKWQALLEGVEQACAGHAGERGKSSVEAKFVAMLGDEVEDDAARFARVEP
jgi:hypothetical protein